ncbi:S-TKc domain containing protein [Pyrenophora tritici-repentis]|uniref:S-TKc domain containing protein n=1 Tax=Pyrenophora tritici-repentis TaxID=45151 RepID=A0A2W1E719_9PLEO|nr:S-TKc domain-containing protein [Pyrenophora tritici-repentis]KAF7443301.1 S-TKc domain containing protein [Pyrenophora tritici-repentis]KAG9377011.1 S-TKc domain containing protein [Pyrenophora tritici-repentis]KAI0573803.1 S-TKc domain-containing protein [Pyrenophora tritici-repentis]KAI0575793.1 S-TKc domain-containing protein [Pyrenophora tritici-repentis]
MAASIDYTWASYCWGRPHLTDHLDRKIPDSWRRDFPSFVIGYKLSRRGKKPDIQIDGIVNVYRSLYDSNRHKKAKKLVKLGAASPDPRLNARNFQLSETLEKYSKSLPKQDRSRFAAFAYGGNVMLLGKNDTDEERIWLWENSEQVVEAYVGSGKHWYGQYQKTRPPVSPPLNSVHAANAHLRDKIIKYPPATLGDPDEVQRVLGAQYSGNLRWMFHSTIFQNGHVENYQRIVHLFVGVDELDHIQKRIIVKVQGERTEKSLLDTMQPEIDLHQRLTTKGCRHIVDFYAASYRIRRIPPILGYVYMEYAPFGDLHDLVDKHHSRKENTVQIPEPML